MTDTIITSDTTSLPVDSPAKASEPLVSATTATAMEAAASLAPVLARIAPDAYTVTVRHTEVSVQGDTEAIAPLIERLNLTPDRSYDGTDNHFEWYRGPAIAPWQHLSVLAIAVSPLHAPLPDCDSADHEAVLA